MTTAQKPASTAAPSRSRLLRIGSVLGVPIFITPSWLLVTAFIAVSYQDLVRRSVTGASTADAYLLSLIYALALAASIVIHELGHTVVSRVLGMQVRRIVVFLLGGVSEIVGEPTRPRDEFSIAVAGPAMSAILAGLCWVASLGLAGDSGAGFVIGLLGWSNVVIAVFNVLPGLPLDGGRLLQALVWTLGASRLNSIRVAAWSGRVVAVVMALAIVAAPSLGGSSISGLGSLGATVAAFAVAAFIWFGAGQTLRQAEMVVRARGLRLEQLVRPAVYLPASTPVAEAVRLVHQLRAGAIVVIDADARSRAIVSERRLLQLPLDQRPWKSIDELAVALTPNSIVSDALTGEQLLEAMAAQPASEYLIVGADGVSRGVVAASDVSAALRSGNGAR